MNVNSKLLAWAKNLTFLSCFVTYQALFHRKDFFNKVFKRFELNPRWLLLFSSKSGSRGDLYYDQGNFEKGIRLGQKKGKFGRLQRRRFEEARAPLSFPIYQSVKLDKANKAEPTLYFVTNSLPYTTSGYAIRTENVANMLRGNGISLRVCTRAGYPLSVGRWTSELQSVQRKNGIVRLIPWSFSWDAGKRRQQSVRLLEREARNLNARLIVTTTSFEKASIVSEVARNLEIPWAYEIRGEPEATWLADAAVRRDESSEFFQCSRLKENEAVQKSAAQIFLSHVSKESFEARGVKLSNPVILPNAVNPAIPVNSEEPRHRERMRPADKEEIVVGSISSLVGYEGFDTLIDALALTEDRFRLLLVGSGQEKDALERRAKKLGLQDRISFVGARPHSEIAEWYEKLDIFVLPRKDFLVTRTVTPIKHFEAMVCGVPIVASDLPALREATGGYATFFEAGNARDLAQSLKMVADGHHQAVKARQWAQERTWTNVGEDLIKELWTNEG